jgi:hypothetical protein
MAASSSDSAGWPSAAWLAFCRASAQQSKTRLAASSALYSSRARGLAR